MYKPHSIMTQSLDFQSIIMSLQEYWSRQGCLVWQPYYTQVGAGTMNPATALRVLGPEPWNVAYVEPSIRPDDGRYGENPNRMQMHYQFQVILKPDPGNPQELYLQSLLALGIDPRQHDIRFVEDNWESPALGAWGLGWEVWLDGQEITQFTYFQQAGGLVLDPVSVELTYGLERIAIALQRVSSFRDIQWSPTRTDGDVNLQAEQEHCTYYFEVADVERLRQMYDLFQAEANACLEKGLVLPAHDYVLKCSHTFNVLDTRGAIGVTERQALFGRMRDLSRRIAELYVEKRKNLEFPWLEENSKSVTNTVALNQTPPEPGDKSINTSHADFLLEIGVEEMPVGDLEHALAQLRQRTPAWLDELRLEYDKVEIFATPRRLVISVLQLASRQPDQELVIKGPPADRAYTADGKPTPAAQGFARSKGLPVEDLQVREIDGGRYVSALVKQPGYAAVQVLAENLPTLIASIKFDKSMRWNRSNIAFSRPIRWLLALYGNRVISFEYAGLRSGNTTRGLRFDASDHFLVQSPGEYLQLMQEKWILVDGELRRNSIQAQVERLATEAGGQVLSDPALLAEVTNLVEAPTALRGTFDAAHLKLPPEVLVSVMKKHQRYFPVYDQNESLLPYFVFIANRPMLASGSCEGAADIVDGNEHVIRARFADAAYFVREDRKKALQAFLPQLSKMTFQVKLGSMLDKTRRISQLVEILAPRCHLPTGELAIARRAAELCKADLATNMVVEMTALQGVMGRYYALDSGEPQSVAEAIYEHYLPRFTNDLKPHSPSGLVVGLADRLDTLAGLFAAGLAPTGSKDPFAQRRAALGLVQNLIAWKLELDLVQALDDAASQLPISTSPESQQACLEFITERLRNLLLEQGFRYDIVDAVLAAQGSNPARAFLAVQALAQWVSRPDWSTILPAYARCVRITRDLSENYPVDPQMMVEEAEKHLFAALQKAENTSRAAGSVDDYLNVFMPMIPAINVFFDQVLVMAEQANIRQNRLGLLQRIAGLATGVADMSRLEGF